MDTVMHLQIPDHAVPAPHVSRLCFDKLPNEILLAIIARIPFNTTDLTNMSLMNRHIHELMLTSKDHLVEDIAEIQYPLTHALRPRKSEHNLARLCSLHRTSKWTVWVVDYSLIKNRETCSALDMSQLAWRVNLGVHLISAFESRRHDPSCELESAFWLSLMPYELLCVLRFTSVYIFAAFRQLVTEHHYNARREELLLQPLAIQAFERSILHLRLFWCFSVLYPRNDGTAHPEAAKVLDTIDNIFESEVHRTDKPFYLHQSLEDRMPGITASDDFTYRAGWGAVITDSLLMQYLEQRETASAVQKVRSLYQDYADTLCMWIENGTDFDGSNYYLAEGPGMPLLCDTLRTYDWCNFIEKMVRSEAGNLSEQSLAAANTVRMAIEYFEWVAKLRKDGSYDEIHRKIPAHGVLTHCKFLAVRKLMLKKARAQWKVQGLDGC